MWCSSATEAWHPKRETSVGDHNSNSAVSDADRHLASSVPMKMRSGCLKSWIGAPSGKTQDWKPRRIDFGDGFANDAFDLVAGPDRDG
jgi:hypothetical protein